MNLRSLSSGTRPLPTTALVARREVRMRLRSRVFVGGTIGAYLPMLWGDTNLFSVASIFFSMVGGLAGIWLGWKLGGN